MNYATLVGMKMHPGHGWPKEGESIKLELDFLAEMADRMTQRWERRFKCP